MSEALIDDSAQRLYISSMLSDPGLFARVHHLLESSYFDSSLQSTVSFMKTYFNEQRSVPPLMIVEVATKAHFDAVPSLSKNDSQYLAEQIASFCQIRAVTEAVLRAPAHIEKGSLGQMVQEIKLASQIALHSDLGIDYFDDPMGRLTESESAEVLISTGWSSVDDLTGGIGRQELILFLANSGGGKSVAKLNLAYNLLQQGLNGVYITLEMRDRVVAKRLDSIISRISGRNIFSNKLKVGQQIEIAKSSGFGKFFIKRMRETTTTANDINSYLRELEVTCAFKPDFIVVDYLDLMASVHKHNGDSLFVKDKFVAEEVRALGFDWDAIVISSSQLGRSAITATREQKSLGQDMIQGGISKINTADLAIALVKDEAMDAAGIFRFEFLKSRNSSAVNKKLEMDWSNESLRIADAKTVMKLERPKGMLSAATPGKNSDSLSDLINQG